MSSVCPTCGVAVVPGYVRCPKCQTVLPQRRSTSSTTAPAGGTSVEGSSSPLLPILGGVALIGVIIAVVVMKSGGTKHASATPSGPAATVTEPAVADPTPGDDPDPTPTATPTNTAPDPTTAVNDLDRALKRERLWGTVEVIGARVDVRSGACADPTMGPVLDKAGPPLRQGGLTKLRCLEQSGAVVFERDL